MIIVCGDSHTATHGAFGALAFGIGTSEVEHVLATQTLLQKKPKNMRITTLGDLPLGVTSKDLVMHIIGVIGTAGGTGHVIEYAGEAIRKLSMVCHALLPPLQFVCPVPFRNAANKFEAEAEEGGVRCVLCCRRQERQLTTGLPCSAGSNQS